MARIVIRVVTAVALATMLTVAQETARAISTPTPNPPVTCPATFDLESMAEDPLLAIRELTTSVSDPQFGGQQYQDVNLRWAALPLAEGCVAVYHKAPGADDFGAEPYARLGPAQADWWHWSLNEGGEHCYRLIGVSGDDTRGPAAETCVNVVSVAQPAVEPNTVWLVGGALLAAGLLGTAGVVVARRRRE